ncbi:MAG: DUF1266 domain-containing protein, partial [Candidatus Obscuribacterales bacterium]|nr:DUF1266 domain-containing protein [Candidatus Obscuribacterales bacterium]
STKTTVTAKSPAPAASTTELSRAQLWALACPALLTENHKHRHDILWCVSATSENIADEKRALKEGWGVNSREDLLKMLNWVACGGHREHFDEIALLAKDKAAVQAAKNKLDPESAAELEEQVAFARENAPKLGIKSLLGWDYCRYIALCRWGTLCGYLSQDEAWAKIMPVAQLLQNTFSSWADLGENYLIGRRFWNKGSENQMYFEADYKKLLSDPKSPWMTIPWRTNLSLRKS